MEHNFNKKRYPVVENQIPKYATGDKVEIVSTQHYLKGCIGIITKIFPAQRNVFYMLDIDGKETSSMPERMLEFVNPNPKGN